MDDASLAAVWVEETLARARAMVERVPVGPRDQSWEAFEASIRGMAAAWLRDVSPYVGLTLPEAHVRASITGDFLCLHRGPTPHRMDARSDRVHLELGPDDHVEAAALDAPPPWAAVGPEDADGDGG